jgi:hypothetical protein
MHLLALALLLAAPVAGAVGEHAEPRAALPSVPVPLPSVFTGELSTPRAQLRHTARAAGAAQALALQVEQVRDDLARALGRDWPGRVEVRLGVGREELESLALPGGAPPPWAAALAYPSHGIILVDGHSVGTAEGMTVLRHELLHVALGRLGDGWPRWFQEGFAVEVSGERYVFSRYVALVRAIHGGRLIPLPSLAAGFPEDRAAVELAYAESASFVAFLLERHGPVGMATLLSTVERGEPFEAAFIEAFHVSLRTELATWEESLPGRYAWTPLLAGSGTLLAVAALVTVVGWFFRRRRYARALEQMALREQAEEAARRILEAEAVARAAALAAAAFPDEPDAVNGPPPPASDDEEGPPPGTLLH